MKKLQAHARLPPRQGSGTGTCPIHPELPLTYFCRLEQKAVCSLCVTKGGCVGHGHATEAADNLVQQACFAADELRTAGLQWKDASAKVASMVQAANDAVKASEAQLSRLEEEALTHVAKTFGKLKAQLAAGWAARITALQAQEQRLADAAKGIERQARSIEMAAPLGKSSGTTPLLSIPVTCALADRAAATAAAIKAASGGWAVWPVAELHGWVSVDQTSFNSTLEAFSKTVTLHWHLSPPCNMRLDHDVAGGGGVKVAWDTAVPFASATEPGEPRRTHWLLRWQPDDIGSEAPKQYPVFADRHSDSNAHLVQGEASAAAAAAAIAAHMRGAALLPTAETGLKLTAPQGQCLFERRPRTALFVSSVQLPALESTAVAAAVADEEDGGHNGVGNVSSTAATNRACSFGDGSLAPVSGVAAAATAPEAAARIVITPAPSKFSRSAKADSIAVSADGTSASTCGTWGTVELDGPGITPSSYGKGSKYSWSVRLQKADGKAACAVGFVDVSTSAGSAGSTAGRFEPVDPARHLLGASTGPESSRSWAYNSLAGQLGRGRIDSLTGELGIKAGGASRAGWTPLGLPFSVGDVVTCEVEPAASRIRFLRNGVPQVRYAFDCTMQRERASSTIPAARFRKGGLACCAAHPCSHHAHSRFHLSDSRSSAGRSD